MRVPRLMTQLNRSNMTWLLVNKDHREAAYVARLTYNNKMKLVSCFDRLSVVGMDLREDFEFPQVNLEFVLNPMTAKVLMCPGSKENVLMEHRKDDIVDALSKVNVAAILCSGHIVNLPFETYN